MLRTFQIALFSVTMMVTACKKAEKPAEPTPGQAAKADDPSKPPGMANSADPAAKPADPAAKPADPAAKPADPAAPAATGNTELETKGIAMMQRMADMFVADEKDCEKMATDIRAFIAQNKDLLTQLTAMEKQQTPQQREAFETRNKAMQETLMKRVTPAMTACEANKNVEAAMKEFGPDGL